MDSSIKFIDYCILFFYVGNICELSLSRISKEFYDLKLNIFYEQSAICYFNILFYDSNLCTNKLGVDFY